MHPNYENKIKTIDSKTFTNPKGTIFVATLMSVLLALGACDGQDPESDISSSEEELHARLNGCLKTSQNASHRVACYDESYMVSYWTYPIEEENNVNNMECSIRMTDLYEGNYQLYGNGEIVEGVAGEGDSAVAFDGVEDGLWSADWEIPVSLDFLVSSWIRFDNFNREGRQMIFHFGDFAQFWLEDQYLNLKVYTKKREYHVRANVSFLADEQTPAFHNVVFGTAGGQLTIWVDGNKQVRLRRIPKTARRATRESMLQMGAYGFQGAIDDVRYHTDLNFRRYNQIYRYACAHYKQHAGDDAQCEGGQEEASDDENSIDLNMPNFDRKKTK